MGKSPSLRNPKPRRSFIRRGNTEKRGHDPMKLTVPMTITAADSEARTISGRIVAFNEPANASTGKVIFAKGSISPKDVFLNLEHDSTRRIGKTLKMELDGERAINASFKIAKTTAGTDAIEEAMTGLRDGFSIELAVDSYEMQKTEL
jgi:phage head maturation protease